MNEELEMVECPWCSSEAEASESYLGKLGNVEHHRCPACHGDFHRREEDLIYV